MKDINYILEMIPHRYPFLLVDRIIDKKDKKEIKKHRKIKYTVKCNGLCPTYLQCGGFKGGRDG